MKCMVLVKASKASEAGIMPTEAELAEMGEFNQRLGDAGVLVDGDGLRPSSGGARVRFTASGPETVKGPFPDPEQLVAGYWVWNVETLEEAIEWAVQIPFNPERGPAEVEIRPYITAGDFGEAFTPELQEKEEALRRQVTGR